MHVLKINREIPVFKILDSRVRGLTNRNEVFYGKHHCYIHKYLNNQVCSATLHFHKYRVCDCPKQTPFLWYFGWVRNSLHYIECPPTRRVSNKLLKGVLGRLVCFLYTPKSIHDCHVSDFAQDFTRFQFQYAQVDKLRAEHTHNCLF